MYSPYSSSMGRNRDRTPAIIVMIIATVLYLLSLAPWLLALMATAFIYDAPENTTLANVMMLGMLGWPVVLIVGQVIGWRRLRLKRALIGSLLPILYGLVMALIAVLVKPEFWGF